MFEIKAFQNALLCSYDTWIILCITCDTEHNNFLCLKTVAHFVEAVTEKLDLK